MTECALLRINKAEMVRVLHREQQLSGTFMTFLLARNARIQADLVDQLFNSSEKRLARILLLLAQFGKESKPEAVVPKISQEILAEMIGTTRSRVSLYHSCCLWLTLFLEDTISASRSVLVSPRPCYYDHPRR